MGYDYYEFIAIDRYLSEQAMDHLRGLWRKAAVTPTLFAVTDYQGSFPGDSDALLADYFDACIFLNKYGVRELKLKFPRRTVAIEDWQSFLVEEDLAIKFVGDQLILTMRTDREGGGWEQGEGWLVELLPTRDELLRGDLRPLYLGWLGVVEHGVALEDDDREPPPPPGLDSLTDPQKVLVNYLAVDWSLVDAAAERTRPVPPRPDVAEMANWIAELPQQTKDAWLSRWVMEDDPAVRLEIWAQFREEHPATREVPGERRTVAGLIERWGEIHTAAEETERQAEDEARKERLEALAEDVEGAWRSVDHLLVKNHWKDRREAIEQLNQLKELATYQGTEADFMDRLALLRTKYRNRPSLLKQFDEALNR